MKNDLVKTELSDWVVCYTKDLFAWALEKTSDRQLAEDLVQETFLAAAQSNSSFRGDSHPKTWLTGILKNKIAAHYRETLRKNITIPLAPDQLSTFFSDSGNWMKNAAPQPWQGEPEHLTDIPAFNQVLHDCIEHLPTTMNACIRLKFLDEKKGEQVCQELGLTATNYWQLIHRAKIHLRNCLEKNWFLAP
jgi:RNA polymerase sigma-70 factor (TIGR02943 family)